MSILISVVSHTDRERAGNYAVLPYTTGAKVIIYPMPQSPLTKYLQTRAIQSPWRIVGCPETSFAGAVVIPALAESAHLFATLRSLAANPPESLDHFLVLVVVNHRKEHQGSSLNTVQIIQNQSVRYRRSCNEKQMSNQIITGADSSGSGLRGSMVGTAGRQEALPRIISFTFAKLTPVEPKDAGAALHDHDREGEDEEMVCGDSGFAFMYCTFAR
jgi:hypothetical protein